MAEEKRRTLLERVFSRSRKDTIEENKKIEEISTVKRTDDNNVLIDSVSVSEIKLLQGTDVNNTDEAKMIQLYRQMENDSIISAALDLYADNATQIDPRTGHVASVECSDAEIAKEINEFLWNTVNIDTEAWQIIRDIARDGKIFLDARISDKEWGFIPVRDPSKVNALTIGQEDVKYFVVAPEEQKQEEHNSLFSIVYNKEEQNVEDYTIEDKDRFIAGFNSREIVGKMTVATDTKYRDEPVVEELLIRSGKSALANVVQTYQVLSSMEDALFINRLTKSTEFKVVQVDVSESNNKQALQIIKAVKDAFKSSETIDMTTERYQNRQSPIPYNDFIYIPIKGVKGSITIETVGGEVGETKMADIDYFRNKLFAGLSVLKAYLGFEETTPGGLGDSTLTMLDERLGRKVVRLQQILKGVIEQIVSYYWRYSSSKRNKENMPEFKIIMGKISTKDEEEKRTRLDRALDTANKIVGLVKDDLFSDKIDSEKLFRYIFNDVVGIDPKHFDNNPIEDDIAVKIHKIGENIRSIAERKVQPTREYKELSALFEEYNIFVDTDKEILTFKTAFNRVRYSRKLLGEKTYGQLKDMSKSKDPRRLKKSKNLIVKYTGIDDDRNVTFRVTAEDPEANKKAGRPTSYKTKVSLKDLAYLIKSTIEDGEKMTEKDLITLAITGGDVDVSCNCPAAKWWGQQYMGTKDSYSLDSNDIPPTVRIPTQPVCKHTLATLTVLPFWYNTIVRDLRAKGILPSTMTVDKKSNLIRSKESEKEIKDLEDIERSRNNNKE